LSIALLDELKSDVLEFFNCDRSGYLIGPEVWAVKGIHCILGIQTGICL